MCVWSSRGGGKHYSLLSPGTGNFTRFHLHKKWMPRLSPNGGVRGFQVTDALALITCISNNYYPRWCCQVQVTMALGYLSGTGPNLVQAQTLDDSLNCVLGQNLSTPTLACPFPSPLKCPSDEKNHFLFFFRFWKCACLTLYWKNFELSFVYFECKFWISGSTITYV